MLDSIHVCMRVIYLPSIIKKYKSSVKIHNDKNNVYDVKYTTSFTELLYHWISGGGDSLINSARCLFYIRVPLSRGIRRNRRET